MWVNAKIVPITSLGRGRKEMLDHEAEVATFRNEPKPKKSSFAGDTEGYLNRAL